jgi:hypothetical protein
MMLAALTVVYQWVNLAVHRFRLVKQISAERIGMVRPAFGLFKSGKVSCQPIPILIAPAPRGPEVWLSFVRAKDQN